MSEYLRKEGNNIVFSIAMIDNDGNAITSGQTVSINVMRISDSKWWNTGTNDFDLTSEPSLISASQIGSTGIYKYALANSWNKNYINYRLHLVIVGTVPYNFSKEEQISDYEGLASLSDIISTDAIKSDIRAVNGSNNIDGMQISYVYELIAAAANGRFKKDEPSVGKITFYKRDNSTVLTVVTVTDVERTRDS